MIEQDQPKKKHMSKFQVIERIAVWLMIVFTVGALVLSAAAAIAQNYY